MRPLRSTSAFAPSSINFSAARARGWPAVPSRASGRLQIELGAVLQEQIDQRPGDIGIAGLLAGDDQPHRGAAVGPERRGIHIGASSRSSRAISTMFFARA